MPDISKINALAIGSVAKVDGLAKASILDINGVAVTTVPPPLDTYTGAAAAYSVRLLRTAYTGDIMRVRRASDNVEADVGFDGGQLKLTSPISNTSDAQSYTDFADFVDHTGTPTDALCRYWYDQSGNANDAGQSTAGSQPQIYDATTGLITENGKPALDFQGVETTHKLTFSSSDFAGGFIDFFTVVSVDSYSQFGFMPLSSTTSSSTYYQFSPGAQAYAFFYQGKQISTAIDITGQQRLIEMHGNSTTGNAVIDGTNYSGSASISAIPSGTRTYLIASYPTGDGWNLAGRMQELILYSSERSGANRTGIEDNLNGFFSIY